MCMRASEEGCILSEQQNELKGKVENIDERLTKVDNSLVVIDNIDQMAFTIDRTSLHIVVCLECKASGSFLRYQHGKVRSLFLGSLLFRLADLAELRLSLLSFFDGSVDFLNLCIELFHTISAFGIACVHLFHEAL